MQVRWLGKSSFVRFNVCFCEFFLARFRSLTPIWGAGALRKRLAQGSVKIVGNAYAADSWQVEQSSDDRYSPQEIDGHRKEATEKKHMASFGNACLRKETDQHIFTNNMHTNNVSRLFYPICAYLHTSFEQLDAFFCSTFERDLINDTLLRWLRKKAYHPTGSKPNNL